MFLNCGDGARRDTVSEHRGGGQGLDSGISELLRLEKTSEIVPRIGKRVQWEECQRKRVHREDGRRVKCENV